MTDFNWTCPHCERAVTISDERTTTNRHTLFISNSDGGYSLITNFIVCPNPDCRRFTLTARLRESRPTEDGSSGERLGKVVHEWRLIPSPKGKNRRFL